MERLAKEVEALGVVGMLLRGLRERGLHVRRRLVEAHPLDRLVGLEHEVLEGRERAVGLGLGGSRGLLGPRRGGVGGEQLVEARIGLLGGRLDELAPAAAGEGGALLVAARGGRGGGAVVGRGGKRIGIRAGREGVALLVLVAGGGCGGGRGGLAGRGRERGGLLRGEARRPALERVHADVGDDEEDGGDADRRHDREPEWNLLRDLLLRVVGRARRAAGLRLRGGEGGTRG